LRAFACFGASKSTVLTADCSGPSAKILLMAEPEQQPAFLPAREEPEGRNWTAIILGAALVVAIIAAFILVGRLSSRNADPSDPYLNKLQLTSTHMSTAHNFAGGSVTYIEGTVTNTGDRKIKAARVLVTFRNALDEITQKETLPVTVLMPNSAYADYGTLDRAPLAPGQSRPFRVTLEYVTRDWDGQIPQLKVVSVGH
jgi:hypothetical protein